MQDLFDKINTDPTVRLAEWSVAQNLNPYFHSLSETEGTEVTMNGRRLLMIGGNNYLGLTTHPHVRAAAIAAIERYGTSCSGSRLLNGTLDLHLELERRLARFLGKEAALTFGTGYLSNLGTITALMGKDDVAVLDRDIHASVVDAVINAGCQMRRFRHNDVDDLERMLRKIAGASPRGGALVVVDGVYSMLGDMPPLPDIARVCKQYGARLLMDDAHGLGVMGPGGRGTHFHLNCADDVDLVIGTFSKSFSSLGGVLAGSEEVINFIRHRSRAFIFGAALPPANIATVLACLDVVENDPTLPTKVLAHATRVRSELRSIGYDVDSSPTPLVAVKSKDILTTLHMWKALIEDGVYVNAVIPPAVTTKNYLLRTSYMATHTTDQIDHAIGAFRRLAKKMGTVTDAVAAAQQDLLRASAEGTRMPAYIEFESASESPVNIDLDA